MGGLTLAYLRYCGIVIYEIRCHDHLSSSVGGVDAIG